MKVLVTVNLNKDLTLEFTSKVLSYLKSKGVEIFIEKELQSFFNDYPIIGDEDLKNIDFCLVLGGDGTILGKAHLYNAYSFPYLGINLGRVGCLTEGRPDNAEEVIDKVLNKAFKVEHRTVLKGELVRGGSVVKKMFAFNEIILYRGKRLKMLNINISVNSSNDTSFYADGVIIATPTGSSAYSLSSGGPLLIPTSKSLVITPVSAQLKTITSLVVDGDDVITLSLANNSDTLPSPQLEIDGRESIDIEPDDVIHLSRATRTLNIIKVNLNESLYEPIFKVTNTFK